jgi:hypothetical protein
VRHFVHGQRPRLAESFAAVVALEGLFLGVDVTVVSEMVLPTEGFSANVTAVGALVGVGSLVDEEVVGFGELPIAVFADELFLWTCSSRASHF